MAFKKRDDKKPKRIHAFVATPAYDGKVHSEYALSMAQAFQAATLHGINATAAVMSNGAFIDLSRNEFVRRFLETDCTHLFFIDSDLEFEPRAFVSLLLSGLPVCAGAYRRRQEPEDYPVKWTVHPEVGGLWVDNGFVMCDRVATGFLCIERSVVEQMAKEAPVIRIGDQPPVPRLFYTYITENSSFMGEDYAWCDDYVKRYQRPIPVWPDFDFKHAGYKCNWHKFLEKQIEEHEKQQEVSTAA